MASIAIAAMTLLTNIRLVWKGLDNLVYLHEASITKKKVYKIDT